jgi:hypothetical protein
MKVQIEVDGITTTRKYWGVCKVKPRETPKNFEDDSSFQKAMYDRTEKILEGKADPLVNRRAGYYVSYAYILGKIRHLGCVNTLTRAARLHDSALFHLWGFINRPKPGRFNYFTAEHYAVNPPELFPVVASLRLKLIEELKLEGTDPTLHDFNYAQSLCQPTIAPNS